MARWVVERLVGACAIPYSPPTRGADPLPGQRSSFVEEETCTKFYKCTEPPPLFCFNNFGWRKPCWRYLQWDHPCHKVKDCQITFWETGCEGVFISNRIYWGTSLRSNAWNRRENSGKIFSFYTVSLPTNFDKNSTLHYVGWFIFVFW